MKKRFLLGAFLMAGTFFGFANEKAANDKVEAVVENVREVKTTGEEKEGENADFATCLRCVRSTTTVTDMSTGESSSSTVQFCHEVPCL